MTRKEFFIEYYRRTDEKFADEMIGSSESRERAWRKGQSNTSKSQRIMYIVLQYLVLLGCLIFLLTGMEWWRIVIPFLILHLPTVYITDFSLLKIELLYRIYRKNTVYSRLLHDIFLGRYDDFLKDLRRATKSKVSGYVCVQWQNPKFYAKFRAVCRKPSEEVFLTFSPRKVKIRANSRTVIICDRSLSREQLIHEIASAVNTIRGK